MTATDNIPVVAWNVVERLFGILASCVIDDVPLPDIAPDPGGGVQVTWRTDAFCVAVQLLNDGATLWSRYEPWSTSSPLDIDLTGVSAADIVAKVATDRW